MEREDLRSLDASWDHEPGGTWILSGPHMCNGKCAMDNEQSGVAPIDCTLAIERPEFMEKAESETGYRASLKALVTGASLLLRSAHLCQWTIFCSRQKRR